MATISGFVPWDEYHPGDDRDFNQQVALGVGEDSLPQFLDEVGRRIRKTVISEQELIETLDLLFTSLRDLRARQTSSEWQASIDVCRRHPIRDLLHEDPFTFRAFSKPRGYAGDAVMMDYIYGREEKWKMPPASRVGQRVFSYTTGAPASEGVRARRSHIADLLDDMARDRHHPDVLAIACGHLREASMSSAVRRRSLGRFLALDVDVLSLAEVDKCYSAYGIETVPASFRRLIGSQLDLGSFDLVYSTGLFDYLKQNIAQRLTRIAFEMLRPGGKLVIANFLPNVKDIGYMESFMDWNLIYRGRQEMVGLTEEILEDEISDLRLVSVENKNIIILEVTRSE